MTYVKKLVMQGFKSFAKRTEIPFEDTLNAIIGPNGSGKSNVSDALCFVLGRLSIKSMRASKASNLIHNGGKTGSPSDQATVELIMDNANGTFPVKDPEVNISRTVKKNGTSTYRINGAVKTRQEVLELMGQAGIDPNGFNIIMQQEITNFVEMHSEERRQIIEQVAGISVYEEKKHKSLLELNRTDEKIKEIKTILNERASYLKNLEKERKEAVNFDNLKKSIEKDKAALVFRKTEDKRKESDNAQKNIEQKETSIGKTKGNISDTETKKEALSEEIKGINKHIEESSGVEQGKMHKEIAQEKVEVATLSVKLENYNQQLEEMDRRKEQLEKDIKNYGQEIESMTNSLPKDVKKMLSSRTESFSSIEEKKTKLDNLKTELVKIKNNIQNKKYHYSYLVKSINELHAKINELSKNVPEKKVNVDDISKKIKQYAKELGELESKRHSLVDSTSGHKREIFLLEKMKKDMHELDSCPICMRKVTKDHVKKVHSNADSDIKKLNNKLDEFIKAHSSAEKRVGELKESLEALRKEESRLRVELVNEINLSEKVAERKKINKDRELLLEEITAYEKRASNLELEINKQGDIEKLYSGIKDELREMTKKKDEREKLLLEVSMKGKDIERMKHIIKKSITERKDLLGSIDDLESQVEIKKKSLEENEERQKQVHEKYQKLFKKRNELQERLSEIERRFMDQKFKLNGIESENNVLRVMKAKMDAELETLEKELEQYKHFDIESLKLKQSKNEIESRIKRHEESLMKIGSVNMKALEVYEKVKGEYDKINEKVEQLETEKNQIMNVIASIDRKKKISFLKVFDEINKGFSSNMLKLAGKDASLDLENKSSPFEGGVDIAVKLGRGKYLDVSSLSGGERTLAALSLIFAIQEMRPYYFYIFDEIDAALDKRNSERLSGLLKSYIKNAQYIMITHNDSLISESPILFGVSMQEGKSKILSLKV
ncbi:chromosome segregation SMC family protein [Nanoarchaeota archaeon]